MKIEHYKTFDNSGCLKATFQAIFQIILDTGEKKPWHVNMSLFRKDNGQSWFGYPSREYTNREGEKKRFRESYPGESGRDGFEDEVRTALLGRKEGVKGEYYDKSETDDLPY